MHMTLLCTHPVVQTRMHVHSAAGSAAHLARCCADQCLMPCCCCCSTGEGRVHACLRENRRQLSDGCRREEMILEQQEAEHIELRPNLLRACTEERAAFCAGVQPGSARVFRCLAEKLADPDFGAVCRAEVIAKLQRRQANWKLDPPLRRACRADVADMCKAEDALASETGEVYRCLVRNHQDVQPGCRRELGRAVHMAFFVWTPESVLTRDCDDDVRALCLKGRPNMDRMPGAIGTCLRDVVSARRRMRMLWCSASVLARLYSRTYCWRLGCRMHSYNLTRMCFTRCLFQVERIEAADSTARKVVREPAGSPAAPPRLTSACRALADVAEPPNMKRAFETSLSVALLETQLGALESRTGLPLVTRDGAGVARSLTLTGWTALAGVAAMVVVAVAGGMYAWRRYTGVPTDATTVVLKTKGRPRYARIAVSE